MAEVTLDANVLVALLDAGDVHHTRAVELIGRLRAGAHEPVVLDVLVAEAVSVLCRRATQRRTAPPAIAEILRVVSEWSSRDEIRWVSAELEWAFDETLACVERTGGQLNFNDAFIVVLANHGLVDELASFDMGFDAIDGLTWHRWATATTVRRGTASTRTYDPDRGIGLSCLLGRPDPPASSQRNHVTFSAFAGPA